jgi:glycosyltransferase involved in cell wall biosynthesis
MSNEMKNAADSVQMTNGLPPKVLTVISSINPRQGGPPVSATSIAIAASRSGVRASTAVCVGNPPLPAELDVIQHLEQYGITVHRFPFWGAFSALSARWGISLPLVFWLIGATRRYDIIQVHGAWVFSTLVAAIIAKLGTRFLVVVPHEGLTNFDAESKGGAVKRMIKRRVRAWLLRSGDAIVFSSALERRDSIEPRYLAKSMVIYHPVLDDERPPQRQRSRSRAADGLRLGFLGRFHPKKNLEILLEAVSQTSNVSLRIAGDGSPDYRAKLCDLVNRLGISDRIEWLGFIAKEQSAAFFDSIDVLAMPSAYECFGRVAAEAMVNGIPTIVTTTTGVAEIVERGRCGIVIVANVIELRSAIERLQSDPALIGELSQRALETSERELSLKAYGESIATVYRSAMKNLGGS